MSFAYLTQPVSLTDITCLDPLVMCSQSLLVHSTACLQGKLEAAEADECICQTDIVVPVVLTTEFQSQGLKWRRNSL